MARGKHKHRYSKVVKVERHHMRGYVWVTYKCMNTNTFCPKPVIRKKEVDTSRDP